MSKCKYFTVQFEHVSVRKLHDALVDANMDPIVVADGFAAVYTTATDVEIRELVWSLNGGNYCEVNEATEDDLREFI